MSEERQVRPISGWPLLPVALLLYLLFPVLMWLSFANGTDTGDGRIPIAAARTYGARAIGVDIDPQRIAEANANAKAAGVTHLVTFKLEDALTTDLSQVTVVTLYLLSSSNLKLRPILTRQLQPGARIVAHNFAMGDWEAEKTETFRDEDGRMRTIYRWTTDGKVRQ